MMMSKAKSTVVIGEPATTAGPTLPPHDSPAPKGNDDDDDDGHTMRLQSPPSSAQTRWTPSLRERQRIATFAAFMGFGLASWIMTNASYIELGVFLRVLPEKYSIFAYSIFALQSANIYPFLYMLLNARQQRVSHHHAIWFLLVLGALVAVLMSFLWKETAVVFGKSHSVAMLVLTHLGGLVSATSSVVFYPYVATFPALYTSGLSTGEGLSGSIAALLGVIQRPYDESSMRFSTQTFYLLCAAIMVVSLLSFGFLELHHWARAAKREGDAKCPEDGGECLERGYCLSGEAAPLVRAESGEIEAPEPNVMATLRHVWLPLVCQLVLAGFSFGVLPSVMPYVYKKYAPLDNVESATSRYQTISSIAALILDPLARFATSVFRLYHVTELTIFLLTVGVTLLVFSLHPNPVASSAGSGYLLPLIAHVGYLVIYAYTQTMIYFTLQKISTSMPTIEAHRVYQWSGFATQIGAFTGTIIIFPLVFFRESLFLA